MAEFYSARGWEIPPLPWTNLSPPFSLVLENVDFSVHLGQRFELEPKTDIERLVDEVLHWQAGSMRIRLGDWLYGENELINASSRAVISLLFEEYGADPDKIPDHIKEMLKAGLEGPYVHADCALVRAVAFDWHKKP